MYGSGHVIVMRPVWEVFAPVLSVTVTVKADVPAVVGWPVMAMGGDVDRCSPAGRAPAEIVAVNGPTPPDRKKFCR